MARVTAGDKLVAKVLERSGEPPNGVSDYIEQVTDYLSDVQRKIVAGATLFDLEVEESWTWAKARHPIILTLQPAFTTGTITFTNNSLSITFSDAPTQSVAGWFIRPNGTETTYRVASHTASTTSATLDNVYLGTSGSTTFTCFKLDYDLYPEYIHIDATKNKFDFSEDGTAQLTATLTSGAYTPTTLAAELKTQLDAAGGSPTYTVTYNSVNRKFTFSSDLAGSTVFQILGATGTSAGNSALSVFGLDDLNYTAASSYTSTYPHGAIIRLVEPIRIYNHREEDAYIYGMNEDNFYMEYPIGEIPCGMPSHFTVIEESGDGKLTIRVNAYPREVQRAEVTYVPYPRDIQNNANSFPIMPTKYMEALEYAATYFIYNDKEDSKAENYYQLTQAQLKSMKRHRQSQDSRTNKNFGKVIPRRDLTAQGRRWRFGYTADD